MMRDSQQPHGARQLVALGHGCPAALVAALSSRELWQVLTLVRPLAASSGAASVSLAQAPDGRLVVVKSYHKHSLEPAELQQVEREFRAHELLDGPHVVPFWAAVEDALQLHIVAAYCEQGDLRGFLADGPLPEAVVRDRVVAPLLAALAELHAKGLVHRDVKPDNSFVSCGRVMLGDFSLAVAAGAAALHGSSRGHLLRVRRCSNSSASSASCDEASSACGGDDSASGELDSSMDLSSAPLGLAPLAGSMDSLSDAAPGLERLQPGRGSGLLFSPGKAVARSDSLSSCSEHAGGTPHYTAPEVVSAAFNNSPLDAAVGPLNDVWALGVLALECLSGVHPFGDEATPPGLVMCNVISGRSLQLGELQVSPACRDWLSAALARDPRRRWSAAQLAQHDWLAKPQQQQPSQQQEAADPDAEAWTSACAQQELRLQQRAASPPGCGPWDQGARFEQPPYKAQQPAARLPWLQHERAPSPLGRGFGGMTSWED